MEKELQDYFGMPVREEKFDNLNGLPFYLIANRKLTKLNIEDERFLVVEFLDDEKYGAPALKKQLQKYYEITGLNAVFSFQGMKLVQRNALLKAKIPFIALPEQVYLPYIGIMFTNKIRDAKQIKKDKMMPVTQQVFLYLLYNKIDNSITKSKIADETSITRMSVTRATEQLSQMGLISQRKIGKEIYVSCVKRGRELFELAKPFLISPIQKEIFVDYSSINLKMLKSGETALGEQTMLNPPKIHEFAIYKNSEDVDLFRVVDKQWDDCKEIMKVQLWKYDPKLFSKNEYVDPVSLFCCFIENGDERIEMQIGDFLEEINW